MFADDRNISYLHHDIKTHIKDTVPLKLPDLHISNKTTERKSSIKFLGVMLDEHIA